MNERRHEMRFDGKPAVGRLHEQLFSDAANFSGKASLIFKCVEMFDHAVAVSDVETFFRMSQRAAVAEFLHISCRPRLLDRLPVWIDQRDGRFNRHHPFPVRGKTADIQNACRRLRSEKFEK